MFKRSWVAAVSFAIASVSISPVTAMPSNQFVSATSDMTQIQQVQHRIKHFDNRRGHYNRSRHDGWYNGHRGYRNYRRGYKRHSDGWWYPLAAFGAGAVIGGAISNQGPAARGMDNRHHQWCASRYRTYRASDNTYVPRAGQRAVCNSPYS